MDVTFDSKKFHGLIAYVLKAKHCSSNAATCNIKESQTLSKNIQCVTTRFKFYVDDCTTTSTLKCQSKYFAIYVRRRSRAKDSCCQIDLLFGSTGVLVWSRLICKRNFPCSVSFGSMFDVEVWTKDILYWLIGGQSRFTTSCHAKMSSTPMNQYRMLNVQTSAPNLIMHQLTATWKVLNAKQPTPDQNSRLNQMMSLMTNSNEERTGK